MEVLIAGCPEKLLRKITKNGCSSAEEKGNCSIEIYFTIPVRRFVLGHKGILHQLANSSDSLQHWQYNLMKEFFLLSVFFGQSFPGFFIGKISPDDVKRPTLCMLNHVPEVTHPQGLTINHPLPLIDKGEFSIHGIASYELRRFDLDLSV